MIISICGSGNSGKSSLALKLAKAISDKKKQVIVIHTDYYSPTFVTFFPSEEEQGSLGKLLSMPEVSQEIILRELNSLKENPNIAILSYKVEENKYQYPEYTKDRAVSLLIHLKHLADVVIIDCQTAFFEDLFAITALEMSDRVIRLVRADLKGLSYYKSCMSLLSDKRFSSEKHIKIVQDIENTGLGSVVAENLSGVHTIIPYVEEMKEQFREERILSKLGKKGSAYKKIINQLVEGMEE